MKRFNLIILLFLMTIIAKADSEEVDGIIYYLINETREAEVFGYDDNIGSDIGSVTIPSQITTYQGSEYRVTSIGDGAFQGCSGLTSITIPNSVTSIGSGAFSRCSGLTSVTIPNSVTSIGLYAFYGCSGLTAVHITDIASWCNISSASNPLSYAHHLYLNGEEVKDLVIPTSVTSIGGGAFYGCSGLTSINIPNSVTSIGNMAFSGCSGLTSINIPNSVTSIGNRAFSGCSGLTSITIPNSVTSIGYDAFDFCSGLTAVNITDLASWCNISFGYDSNPLSYAHHLYLNGEEVKDLVIPNSVTSIGDRAFSGCSGLTSITIPNSVTSIGSSAFFYCSGLTSITIPNSVTSIGDWAFEKCSGLTAVTIPNSVTSIGYDAFYGCSLTSVTLDSQTLLSTGYRLSYFFGDEVKSYTIGESIIYIGDEVCKGLDALTSVTIGEGVRSIGNRAFEDCKHLTEVRLGSNTEKIGAATFNNCLITRIYCYAYYPPSATQGNYSGTNDSFSIVKRNCKLFVKPESVDLYKVDTYWSQFNILPMDEETLGIEDLRVQPSQEKEVSLYTQSGIKTDAPQKGVNIIRYSNGQTKKVFIK